MFLRKEKNKPLYKILGMVLVFSFVLNMFSLYYQSVKSAEFKDLERKIETLNTNISNLNFKLSKSSSLVEIETKAKNLGFVKIEKDIKVINTSDRDASLSYNIANEAQR